MKQKLKLATIAISLLGMVFIYACSSGESTKTQNVSVNKSPPPTTPLDELATGQDLYQTNCAKCHQDNGTGGKVTIDGKLLNPKDLTSDRMKARPDKKLIDDITQGSPDDGMPAFKAKLTESEINEVVRYIRSDLQGK
jgi:mono/diheme cytochrome c family protein